MTPDDRRHMAHALVLARRGLGNVWPNPAVGCVIVKDNRVLGRGWTQPGGRPHAEPVALAQAGAGARGATAYVTLEPCSHHGRTPPCADALIAAGVARVVVALTDPDPRVSGRGLKMLQAAGIEVTEGVGQDQARRLQAGFFSRIIHQRPFVTLKLAASFDGRIATAGGDSRWITGPQARRHTHTLRLSHDAVMVAGGTARADMPALNIRGMGAVHQPVRIIVTRGDLPDLARDVGFGPLWHATSRGRGACDKRLIVDETANGLDPVSLMSALAAQGLTRVFCEGGGQFAASLLRAGMVDELVGYTAGLVIGGDARPAIGPLHFGALAQAPRFDLVETRRIGPDLFHRWRGRA